MKSNLDAEDHDFNFVNIYVLAASVQKGLNIFTQVSTFFAFTFLIQFTKFYANHCFLMFYYSESCFPSRIMAVR